MGDTNVLQRADAGYVLVDVLLGLTPGMLLLVGEHSATGEVITDRATIRRCGYALN